VTVRFSLLLHAALSSAAPSGAIIGGSPAPNGIAYHGGPVILGTTQIYYIWLVVCSHP
jgi:hypothetical protein